MCDLSDACCFRIGTQNSERAPFNRRSKWYRVGLMPQEFALHMRKVRSGTPIAEQSAGKFRRGS